MMNQRQPKRRPWSFIVAIAAVALAQVVVAWFLLASELPIHPDAAETAAPQTSADEPLLAPLPDRVPAPADNPTTPEKIALGKQLFFDPRLSGDNTMSCATCHLPDKALADGRPRAVGRDGKVLARNVPSLWNVGFYDRYFWDGRAESLEQQALGPIQSPDEMNQNLDKLERELAAVPGYVEQFQHVFGTGTARESIAQALAAFQRSLVTPDAPIDRYLKGDRDALSAEALEGLELFTGEAGCAECHRGPLLSDGKFHRLGIGSHDEGRGAITGQADDARKFRTPGLRNVALTAPYMHDGSLATLSDVVTFYYRGVTASPGGDLLDVKPLVHRSFSEIPALVAFLESLTAPLPEITPPELP